MGVALVTGASKGIGLAICEALYKSGYTVIGVARNNTHEPFLGHFFQCDLSDIQQTEDTLKQIKQKFPNVDCIINNVGIALPEPLLQVSIDSLNIVFDLNVRTALQVTQAFIDNMTDKKFGRIVNIASRAIFGAKNRTSYSAAKSALVGLTRTWALELAATGVTVNAVSPGPTETELFRRAQPAGSDAEKYVLNQIPMGRIGKPEEIAAAVLFLLSREASFITGQNICVDGGASL